MNDRFNSIAFFLAVASSTFIVAMPQRPRIQPLPQVQPMAMPSIPMAWDRVATEPPAVVDAGLIFNRHEKHRRDVGGSTEVAVKADTPIVAAGGEQKLGVYREGEEINGHVYCNVGGGYWVDGKGKRNRWVMTPGGWRWTPCGKCGRTTCTCGEACPGQGCACGVAAAVSSPVASGNCANGQCGAPSGGYSRGVLGRRR